MKITINISDSVKEIELEAGESLLDAINRASIEGFDASCGGKGTCGKCRVLVKDPLVPDDVENKYVSEEDLRKGFRLACRVFPETDMEMTVDSEGKKAAILTSFIGDISDSVISDESICKKKYIELSLPSIDDQRSDYNRLADSLKADFPDTRLNLSLLEKRLLPALLRDNDFKITATSFFDVYTHIVGGDCSEESYAIAVDIGTTTVVAYLLVSSGGRRGKIVDLVSELNSQKGYGADVISRIEYCMQDEDKLEELRTRIINQISAMAEELTGRNNISSESVDLITIAGNTSMMHIFSGLDPRRIASAPFIPVDTGLIESPASDFGLKLGSGCRCLVLPGIASYVGADITSGIAATGIHESEALSLLIDIGTNGEIVLGSSEGLTACSTAAGPALEGASISCGMGGVPGAINSLNAVEKDQHEIFSYSVIGDIAPVGMCGSGIVDAIALFVEAGVVDETGRIQTGAELAIAGVHMSWVGRVFERDGMPALKIVDDISITQKDIREIQMAKAAIAAGVKTLLADAGKNVSDIKKLFIAGGFGAAMNKRSAAVIGLYPPELEDSVIIAGNTAGKGAVMAALSRKVLDDMERIAANVNYIELSTSTIFQQEYMNAMYF